jgi:hypothetical protein
MSHRKWMDNAFWETDEKEMLNCILEIEDDVGRVTRQVMKLRRTIDDEGNENPDFIEVVETLGEDLITENTNERNARKKREAEEDKQRELEHAKARKLEQLFNYKLEAFEIDDIKNSKNRQLKSKLRRAKNRVEVDLFAIMIVMEEMKKREEEAESGEE